MLIYSKQHGNLKKSKRKIKLFLPSHMDKPGIFFPSLNGIRALAASMVIVHHIEMVKSNMGMSVYKLPGDIGGLGVTLFFVLSGFLITYLLFAEQQQTGTIQIKNFYIRRILRIWPLYYLIVVLSFFLFSQVIYPEGMAELQKHYWIKFVLNIFLMANVSHACIGKVPLGSNLWSVGTEEQFYLIWPWLVKKLKSNGVPLLIAIMVILGLSRILLSQYVYAGALEGTRRYMFFLLQFLNLFRIDCMAMGALGAWILFFKKGQILKFIFHKATQVIVWIACITSFVMGITYFDTMNHIIYSFFFIIILMNLAANKSTMVSLENKVLNFLGKISYGLYVYHFIAVIVILKLLNKYIQFNNAAIQNIVIYVFVFVLSIVISSLSYRFIEKPLLRMKSRFTNIISGDAVNEKQNS